jgi:hypothetical protein
VKQPCAGTRWVGSRTKRPPPTGTRAVYLTEDESDGCFYRFVPAAWGDRRSSPPTWIVIPVVPVRVNSGLVRRFVVLVT